MKQSASREAFQAAMHEAHELAWALKWEAASHKYREALALFPDDPTARLSLAVCLAKTGQLAEALGEYLAARKLLPRDTLVLARIAELRLRLGQLDEAIRAYLDLASLHLAQGETAKAAAAWRTALEHADGQRRHLQAIRDAVAAVGDQALLSAVEAALAHARPEQAGAATAASEPSAAPPTEGAGPASPVAEAASPAARAPTVLVVDPAHRIAEAERHAREGEPAAAIADYLHAAGLLTDPDEAAAARRAAARLAGEWLAGDFEEVLELPIAQQGVVVEAMAESYAHLEQGRYSAALDECYRAIAASPAYLPAQLRLAQVARRMGNVEDARQREGLVVELHQLAGRPRRAAAALRQQLELEPDREELRQRLVDSLLAARDRDEAADELLIWARRRLAAGDVAGGLERQLEAARIAPRADHWLEHGRTLEEHGQIAEALAAFERARQLAPAEELISLAETRCQALLGLWPEMEANLEHVLAAIPTDTILAEEAIAQYRAALARSGDQPALDYCLGRTLFAVGQSEDAARHLMRAAAEDSRPGRLARYHLGRVELARGQTAQGIACLWGVGEPESAASDADRALSLATCQLLADACERAGDWKGAARALDALRRANPTDEALYARLGEVQVRGGQVAAALSTLDQLADLYRTRSDYDRAIAIYQGMAGFAPDEPAPREKLGRLCLELGQTGLGLAQLERAVALQLERGLEDEAAENLRLMLETCRQSDPTRALGIREKLAALRPADVELRRELVDGYLKAGRPVKALAEARSMVDYLLGADRLEEAAAALRLVVRLDPWNLAEQVRLGNLLARLGRTDEAAATLKRVLARDPANQPAISGLAALSDEGRASARE